MLQSVEGHYPCRNQIESQDKYVLKEVISRKSTTKEIFDIVAHGANASPGTVVTVATQIQKEITAFNSDDRATVVTELRDYKSLVYVVAWRDPICEIKNSIEKLWTDDESRKEVVQPNEDAC